MAWQPPPPPGSAPSPPAAPAQPKQTTLYEVLQVDSNAHPTIIRYAYRFLAGMYHPDNGETGNTELFRIVSEAFRTLSDAGRRSAYDAQMGVKKASTPTAGAGGTSAFGGDKGLGSNLHHIPKTGISYNEVELRLAVLQVLLTARKKRPQTGGASAKMLMDVLNIEMTEMEFVLWYLREKELIIRTEALFMITASGVDYLVDSLAKTQVMDDGGKGANLGSIQLPATLGGA